MTYNRIIEMINEYLEEPHIIDKEWVECLRLCKQAILDSESQKAEIERLNIRNKTLTAITKNYDWKFAKAKAEAIKEFAERLKEEYAVYEGMGYAKVDLDTLLKNIDNLIKEMAGE